MKNNLAENIQIAPEGGFKGFGKLGLDDSLGAYGAGVTFNKFISTTIGVMTIVAFVWFLIQIFVGAIAISTAGGDKQKMQEAKSKLSSSIIGLVVVVAAIFLIEIVGSILGIEDILNPAILIQNIINKQ